MDIWNIFILLLTSRLVVYACPDACTCDADVQLVNCSSRSLGEIPGNIPATTKRLLLDRNQINNIGKPPSFLAKI